MRNDSTLGTASNARRISLQGHFNLCIVVVEPLEHGMNRVTLKTKDERLRGKFLAHVEPQCVSDLNVALLARQHALHAAVSTQCALRGTRCSLTRRSSLARMSRSWRRRSRSR